MLFVVRNVESGEFATSLIRLSSKLSYESQRTSSIFGAPHSHSSTISGVSAIVSFAIVVKFAWALTAGLLIAGAAHASYMICPAAGAGAPPIMPSIGAAFFTRSALLDNAIFLNRSFRYGLSNVSAQIRSASRSVYPSDK